MKEEYTTILTCRWEKWNTEDNKTSFRIDQLEHQINIFCCFGCSSHPKTWGAATATARATVPPTAQTCETPGGKQQGQHWPPNQNTAPRQQSITHQIKQLPIARSPYHYPCWPTSWHQSAETRMGFSLTQTISSFKSTQPAQALQWPPTICRVSSTMQGM